jgi:predicted enzyme related to lactoylglutathione lyase
LFTPGSGPPPGPQPAQGAFSWHELATTDVAAAVRFYGTLFGWTKGQAHDMGPMGIYQIFDQGGSMAGGICNVQGPSTPPSWLSYVHVADSNRAVAATKAGGGRLLHGPMEVQGGSWIALLIDPQGGAFAVQEAPRAAAQKPAAAAKPAAGAKPTAAAKPATPPSPKPAPAPAKPAAPAAPKPAAARAPTPVATAAKVVVAAKVAKKVRKAKAAKKAVKKAVKKAARKARRTARKTARKSARKTARAVRRVGRKTARKTRRAARKTARALRRGARRVRRAARRRR